MIPLHQGLHVDVYIDATVICCVNSRVFWLRSMIDADLNYLGTETTQALKAGTHINEIPL